MGLGYQQILAAKSKGAQIGFSGVDGNCESIYDSYGATSDKYWSCLEAYKTGDKNADKYEQALLGGYKGSFEQFKKDRLQSIVQTGGAILGSLFGSIQQGTQQAQNTVSRDIDNDSRRTKNNAGVIILISVLAVGAIGAGIYFAKKK